MTQEVFDNDVLHPWFNSEEKAVLQKAALETSNHAQAAVADDLALIQNQLDALTVSPLAFSFTASPAQTAFAVNGVSTDQGELVLVFKNGIRLRPTFDYTVAFTLDPEVTTITLLSPATGGDIISGVIYNIAVDTIGAVDAQARTDISNLASNLNATIDTRIGLTPLNSLADVVVTSPAVGQIVRYDGTNWVNVNLAELIPLQDLSNVTITSPAVGQVLKWNGSAWVNDTDQTGGGAGATNLSFTQTATTVTVESDTGLDAILPAATTSLAGIFPAADKTKLDGIATGATANAADSALRDRSTHTGTQLASTISDFNASARGQVEATLIAGTNVTITPAGSGATRTLTISATGGGGGGSVSSVGFTSSDSSLTVSNSPITTSGTISVSLNTVPINKGGTGATTASAARTNLGLGTAATSNTGDFAAASHNHDASAITSGTLADARIPNLDASKVTTGQFADARRGVYVQSTAPTGVTGGVWIW